MSHPLLSLCVPEKTTWSHSFRKLPGNWFAKPPSKRPGRAQSKFHISLPMCRLVDKKWFDKWAVNRAFRQLSSRFTSAVALLPLLHFHQFLGWFVGCRFQVKLERFRRIVVDFIVISMAAGSTCCFPLQNHAHNYSSRDDDKYSSTDHCKHPNPAGFSTWLISWKVNTKTGSWDTSADVK